MTLDRRQFLRHVGVLTAASSGACASSSALASSAGSSSHGHASGPADPAGVLVDLSVCIGCRACEHACKTANGLPAGSLESYDDASVFKTTRRPSPESLTVVNAWPDPRPVSQSQPQHRASGRAPDESKPPVIYAKVNCVHCNYPACVSACIVGALQKQENGAVTYDAWKCIGCRYCMVACPMQLPSYEYDNAFTPQVRKCQLCFDQRTNQGQAPACVEGCPQHVMTFGKRRELLAMAHERIAAHPDRYVDHVYGEHEVGGTSWLYLSPIPFKQAGFLELGSTPPPALTEAIQHGVFKYWIAPVGWYAFLASMMWFTGRKAAVAHAAAGAPAHDHASSPSHAPTRGEDLHASDGQAGAATLDPPGLRSLALPVLNGASATAVALPWPGQAHRPPSARRHDDDRHGDPRHPASADAHAHASAAPVDHPLLTPGVWILIALVAVGVLAWLYRMAVGLAASTNLDQQHPWGLWIAMDVGGGIALAGGGFVTAALVHIFHREHYHAVARSALLTALLGYTFYVPGLLADIGRWYNIWHPTIPSMWQGNSVLFEVGLCVMIYLNVQYAELAPIVCERFLGQTDPNSRARRLLKLAHDWLERIMPALLVLGVCLSTFHQSSLGNLMVIAPYKLHTLWWTPVAPLQFLLSAMMVGFPMVIFTILFASWSLKRQPEMEVLGPLSRYVVVFLAMYLAVKLGDVAYRGVYVLLLDGSPQSFSWLAEVGLGVIAPMVALLFPAVRRSPGALAAACLAVILGVVLNRLNVFIIAYDPPYATRDYFPSLVEMAVSAGLVAALMLTYRVAVTYLPILEPRPKRV